MLNLKSVMVIITAVLAIAGGIKTYHLAVNYFETEAHASAKYEEIEADVAMVSKSFQGFSLRQTLRDYKQEVYDLRDRHDTTDPMQILDQEDRDRYRYLLEEIGILEDELEELKEKP